MAENIESFYEIFFCDIRGVAEIIEVLFGGRPRRDGMVSCFFFFILFTIPAVSSIYVLPTKFQILISMICILE